MSRIKMLFVLLTAFMPSLCLAQHQDTVVFKNASKIILKNALTANENFLAAGQSLIDNGFLVGSKDEQFKQINCEPIKLVYGVQVIFITAKDRELTLTSRYKTGTKIQVVSWAKTDALFEPVKFSKNSREDQRVFENMAKVVKLIPNTKVLYSE